jgi:hypothetical protein
VTIDLATSGSFQVELQIFFLDVICQKKMISILALNCNKSLSKQLVAKATKYYSRIVPKSNSQDTLSQDQESQRALLNQYSICKQSHNYEAA